MARKVFLSFLGTSPYVPCNYFLEGNLEGKVDDVKFVQEATFKIHLASNFDNIKDKVFICLTEEAKAANWLNKDGLKARFGNLGIDAVGIDIPKGFNNDDIWKIFDIIYNLLEENDEIIFDVTHAFRSQPILAFSLVSYARALKNITLKGIFYGAFEVLGRPIEVKGMPIEERNAPIIDLTGFVEIQDWAMGAHDFLEFGNTKKLADLALKDKKRASQDDIKKYGEFVRGLRSFSENLVKLSNSLSTVRGKELIENKVVNSLLGSIITLKDFSPTPALLPIMDKVSERVSHFKDNDLLNGFRAVEWAISAGLTQQGITFLREFICCYALSRIEPEKPYLDRYKRELMSSCLSLSGDAKFVPATRSEIAPNMQKQLYGNWYLNELCKELRPTYQMLEIRNDINHAGLDDKASSGDKFAPKLQKAYDAIKTIIEKHSKITL